MPPRKQPPPPETFGKYRVLERVASGGMAEIYKAKLEGEGGFHRTFALKRILPHLASRPEFADMLVEEAKIAGLLSHANIVQIMDLGEVDGSYYIAMEYVNGPDLGRVLARCRDKGITLPVPHAVFVAIEVLKALEYAHNRRVLRGGREMPLDIVHRDVSPANVLLSFQGEVKLTDFGIAKASVKALQTVSGIIKGRFDYLSPEQAAGHKPDARADLFAVGVLLYETLTGRHPFRQRAEAATLDAIRDARFESPTMHNPDVPYALETVLERALAADPKDRFQNATEFKEALDRFFHDAGFIFSHSTLAAFLKGLFPEQARPVRDHGARPDDDLLLDEDELPLDDDSADAETRLLHQDEDSQEELPTVADMGPAPAPPDPSAANPHRAPPAPPRPEEIFPGLDSTVRRPPSSLALAADMPDLPGAPPLAGMGEGPTLIRPGPDLGDEWEAETVIKHEADLHTARPQQAQPRRLGRLPAGGSVTQPAPDLGQRPTMIRDLPPPRGTSWRVHVLYLALVVVVGVFMLFAGVLLTRARLQPSTPAATAAIKREPRLQVHLPDDASFVLDGRTVPGPSPIEVVLDPGRDHQLEVRSPGHAPLRTTVRLEPGEERVLGFEHQQLKAAPSGRR